MSQTPKMKKETIKKKVYENFPDAIFYDEDEESVWFLVRSVSSKTLSWARLPYVILLPCNSVKMIMRVFLKF